MTTAATKAKLTVRARKAKGVLCIHSSLALLRSIYMSTTNISEAKNPFLIFFLGYEQNFSWNPSPEKSFLFFFPTLSFSLLEDSPFFFRPLFLFDSVFASPFSSDCRRAEGTESEFTPFWMFSSFTLNFTLGCCCCSGVCHPDNDASTLSFPESVERRGREKDTYLKRG